MPDTLNPLDGDHVAQLVIEHIANRWTVRIVRVLEDGPRRFLELRSILGASSQTLTRALRALERDGLISRTVFAEVPARVEYGLTALGASLCPLGQAIQAWAEANVKAVHAAQRRYDAHATRSTPRRARRSKLV